MPNAEPGTEVYLVSVTDAMCQEETVHVFNTERAALSWALGYMDHHGLVDKIEDDTAREEVKEARGMEKLDLYQDVVSEEYLESLRICRYIVQGEGTNV